VWTWNDGARGGELRYDERVVAPTIELIRWPYLGRRFRFGDILAAYGQPSHIRASAWVFGRPPDYYVRLIYLPQGFMVSITGSEKLVIDENLAFDDLEFFDPASSERKSLLQGALPWQGMQSFDTYCRDVDNDTGCETFDRARLREAIVAAELARPSPEAAIPEVEAGAIEVAGYYRGGFETSAFQPCGSADRWWTVAGETLTSPYEALTNFELEPVFVRLLGTVSTLDPEFLMDGYPRKVMVTTILEVRAPMEGDCAIDR
jgi:hypothetical protein